MRDDLASISLVRDSANLGAVPFEVIRSTSARLAPLRPDHRRKAQRRPNAEGEARATLASAAFRAALVNWPLAERCGVTLECCTQAQAAGIGVGVLPHVRAVISAVIAMVVNSSVGGSVVTCSARVIDGDAVVSVVTTHCTATMLDVGRAIMRTQDETVPAPRASGFALDLWRANRLARLSGAKIAFVPQKNGNIGFRIWLGRVCTHGIEQ